MKRYGSGGVPSLFPSPRGQSPDPPSVGLDFAESEILSPVERLDQIAAVLARGFFRISGYSGKGRLSHNQKADNSRQIKYLHGAEEEELA